MKIFYKKFKTRFNFFLILILFYNHVNAQTSILTANTSWKYLDNGTNPGTSWKTVSFNDALWKTGNAELGFGDAPVTIITSGRIGYHFRKIVSITNPAAYSGFTLKVRRDDGIVVYVNNTEVYRNNMPGGIIGYNTRASTNCSDDGNTVYTYNLSSSLFTSGNNIVAAEVHNYKTNSSDVTFELQLTATPISIVCIIPDANTFGVDSITTSSAKIFWTSTSGSQSYNFKYRTLNSEQPFSSVINQTTPSIILPGLQSSTSYEYVVQSVCSANTTSAFSSGRIFNTLSDTPVCETPDTGLFIISNIKSNAATLRGFTMPGAESYTLRFKTSVAGATYSTAITTTLDSFVIGNLQQLTNYQFIIQAVCPGNIMSTYSPGRFFTTIATPPPATCSTPSTNSFGTRNATSTSIEVYWTAVSGAQSYNVQYRRRNVGANYSSSINTTIPSLVLNNLLASTNYEFIVQAVCAGNVTSSFSSSGNFTTPATPVTCSTPNVNTFGNRNKTSSSIEVYWGAVTGAQSYKVQYRKRNAGESYSSSINASSTFLVISNLQSLTNYEFIVQSVCSATSSSTFSTSGWFTTSDVIIPPGTLGLVRGAYMTIAKTDSININWRTNRNSSGEIKYGFTIDSLNQKINTPALTIEHAITLNNLLPDTKYYYSIGAIDTVLQGDTNNYFYTAPLNGNSQSVKFWVTGDFGDGSNGQALVRNSFTNYTIGQKINGWLWLGDNAYSTGTDNEYQTKVFNVYQTLFKKIPVFPAPGNHDYGTTGYLSASALTTNFAYFNIFTLPDVSGTEKYYSTNYGNIHFISLDSYGSYNNATSAMYNWLQADLTNNTQTWTIVYFHHPPFSKGSHNSDVEIELIDMRNNIVPLLESFGVDLVLTGHSHTYERSYFIKNHFGLENTFDSTLAPAGHIVQAGGGPYTKASRTDAGTIYLVCGVSGAPAPYTTAGYPHNAMFRSFNNISGSLLLEIDSVNLNCKFLSVAGSIQDEFTMTKTIPPPSNRLSRINISEKSQTVSALFPNPTNGDIIISINNAKKIQVNVTISDITGKYFFRNKYYKESGQDLNISKSDVDLPPGIYIVSINGDHINDLIKLIKY